MKIIFKEKEKKKPRFLGDLAINTVIRVRKTNAINCVIVNVFGLTGNRDKVQLITFTANGFIQSNCWRSNAEEGKDFDVLGHLEVDIPIV